MAAARQALADLKGPDGDTAATTFVSVVAKGHEVTVCWRGDSRAYWLDESAPKSRLLTREDSEAGGMITADLVDDSERAPHVDRFAPPGAGSLLICSDGLWMYRPEAASLAALVPPTAPTDPLGAVADKVKFAIEAGGADNITAVIIPFLGPE